MVLTNITTLDEFDSIILRKTFGSTFCPCLFTDSISELLVDLRNDLLAYENWDGTTLCSPHAKELELQLLLDDSVPSVLLFLLML